MSDNQTVLEPFSYTLPQRPIADYFPFEKIRPAQERAFEAVINSIIKGKRNIVLELPTGTGKSGIAFAVASWVGENRITPVDSGYQQGAYILSTQLSLTEQYVKDFGDKGLVELRGSNNYQCDCYGTTCSMGSKLKAAAKKQASTTDDPENYPKCGGCPYRAAKNAFKESPVGISNFAYFLNETHYAKELQPREVMIVDEAHNVEAQVVGHADIEVTPQRCRRFDIPLPSIDFNDRIKVFEWLKKVFVPKGESIEVGLSISMGEAVEAGDMELARRLAKEHDSVDKFICKVRRFTNTDDINNWMTYRDGEVLKIKPLFATMYSEELLLRNGALRLFMSATILDVRAFCKNIGLPVETTGFMRLPSEFPAANRPVIYRGVGSMSKKNVDETMPNMLRALEIIMTKHPDTKGMIHTNSYNISEAFVDHLRTTIHGPRILAHNNLPGDRVRVLQQHLESPEPTVLVSPSMTEGVDLKNDLARWQIVAKIPYPNLGDAWVRARKDLDGRWYNWLTVLSIIQASGRVVRSETDWATTYIFDKDLELVLKNSRKMLPDWWLEALD